MNAAVATEKLSNLEWVGQQMRAKTANYEASTMSTGEKAPTWEERCGAIASIEDQATKAYCEMLVWGDSRDTTQAFKILVEHIGQVLYDAEITERQRHHFDLKLFCKKIARMQVYFSLRPEIKEDRTLQGQLKFCGIDEIKADTYSKNYAYLGAMVNIMLKDMEDEIDYYVGEYRKKLNKTIN
ncbi:hypothetical protein ACMHYC_10860 [Acinetobacter courvalinii]|uniref:hypothetical protein n=1 Tax=Acinetobacter courvalinii TaxID=280147 RepID=UPI0039C980F4